MVDKETRVCVTAVSLHELSKRCLHHFANFIGVYGYLTIWRLTATIWVVPHS